jgi:hypothetical protein
MALVLGWPMLVLKRGSKKPTEWPMAGRRFAGKPKKRKYSRQIGNRPGNPG